MKPEFHEDYQNPNSDPLDSMQTDFDWNEVYRALGEEVELSLTERQKLSIALRRICQWLLTIEYNIDKQYLPPYALIGRRAIALAWVVNPDLFPNAPSLYDLSRWAGVGAPILAEITGEVSREFGIQNRAQAHAWNRGLHNGSTTNQNPAPHSQDSPNQNAATNERARETSDDSEQS